MSRQAHGVFESVAGMILLAALSGCQADGRAGMAGGPPAYELLPNPYETVRDWGALLEGRTWGQVSGIGIDPDGRHIWVADRCGTACTGSSLPVVLRFDPSGELVRSFGGGLFIRPHGLHVDGEGNVWVTDVRGARPEELERFPGAEGKGHAVYEFSPEGELLLTLGTPGVAGGPPYRLSQPTDVVTAPNGDIFVAEGHSNERGPGRVTKFSADGTFLLSFGRFGTGPGEFRTPHALAFDGRGRLFVADRGNSRIQIFDQEGRLLEEWRQFGRPNDLYIDDDDVLYVADSESDPERNPGYRRGIYIGSARDGEVTAYIPPHELDPVRFSGRSDVPYGTVGEGVAVDGQGNIYAAEVVLYGLTKYVRR